MNRAYLLIGGNIGNREGYLSGAITGIQNDCGRVVNRSSIYQTAAWGLEEQAPFLNQVVEIETGLDPYQLLKKLLGIEESLGRRRDVRYGPRIIDIDILLFNAAVVSGDQLVIPHPQMQNRRFVLEPLTEVAGDFQHPVLLKTIRQLLAECPDKLTVQKFK